MNPAMLILLVLVAVGVWFLLARKDIFVRTENFIDESINMGIHEEYQDAVDVDFETEKY